MVGRPADERQIAGGGHGFGSISRCNVGIQAGESFSRRRLESRLTSNASLRASNVACVLLTRVVRMMRGLSPEHRHSDHASSGVSAAERAEVPASEGTDPRARECAASATPPGHPGELWAVLRPSRKRRPAGHKTSERSGRRTSPRADEMTQDAAVACGTDGREPDLSYLGRNAKRQSSTTRSPR
jgi:hypothetical protein